MLLLRELEEEESGKGNPDYFQVPTSISMCNELLEQAEMHKLKLKAELQACPPERAAICESQVAQIRSRQLELLELKLRLAMSEEEKRARLKTEIAARSDSRLMKVSNDMKLFFNRSVQIFELDVCELF